MSHIFKRLISYVGKNKLEDIADPTWRTAVKTRCEKIEEEDSRVKQALIKGVKPHKSHTDPSDPEDVISIRYFNEDGVRLGTEHVHVDGSAKASWKHPKKQASRQFSMAEMPLRIEIIPANRPEAGGKS